MKISSLLFLSLFLLQISLVQSIGTYDNSLQLLSSYDYVLHWTVASDRIHFAITANLLTGTDTWVGFGIGTGQSPQMYSGGSCSDAIVASVSSNCPSLATDFGGVGCVDDLWICGRPSNLLQYKDTTQNVDVVSLSKISNTIGFEFVRMLDTGDSTQDRVITLGSDTNIIFAIGENSDGTYVHHSDRGFRTLKFELPPTPTPTPTLGPTSTPTPTPTPTNTEIPTSTPSTTPTSTSSPTNAPTQPPNSPPIFGKPATFSALNGDYSAVWYYNEEKTQVSVSVTAKTNGWAAFGIDLDGEMPGVDAVLAYFDDSNQFKIYRVWASIHDTPAPDDVSHLSFTSGSRNGEFLNFNFTRNVTPDDSNDVAITNDTTLYLLYAVGPVEFNTYTKHTQKGSSKVDFFVSDENNENPDSSPRAPNYYVHGTFMMIAWMFFLGTGIILAFKYKEFFKFWFQLHVSFQFLGSSFVITGFAVIINYIGYFRVSAHSILGLIVFIGLCIQIILGIISHYSEKVRHQVHLIHRWVGRFIFLLSFVTMILGINMIGGTPELYALVSVWFVIICVLLCIPIGSKSIQDIDMDKPETTKESKLTTKAKVVLSLYVGSSFILVVAVVILLWTRVYLQ